MKKSESKQQYVRDRYEKLAPLVMQGSYHTPKLQNPAQLLHISEISQRAFFSEDNYLLVTALESGNEVLMKNYLLKPHKRLELCKGNVWLVKANGLSDCWRFIRDKYFLCIHFIYDEKSLIRNISPEDLSDPSKIARHLYESDVCMGILTKRGNASIKSMLKVYKLETEYEAAKFNIAERLKCPGALISGINTIGLMMRMELYLDEDRWKALDVNSQSSLNALMSACEEQIIPTLFHWNEQRSKAITGKTPLFKHSIFKLNMKGAENISAKRLFKQLAALKLDMAKK